MCFRVYICNYAVTSLYAWLPRQVGAQEALGGALTLQHPQRGTSPQSPLPAASAGGPLRSSMCHSIILVALGVVVR